MIGYLESESWKCVLGTLLGGSEWPKFGDMWQGITEMCFLRLQRLRDGVIRDIERQNRKKENIRLLREQIILTEQLEAERQKILLEQGSKDT